MVTRDPYGTIVSEGDVVSYALALGTVVPAKIVKISAIASQNMPPLAILVVEIPVPIPDNGVIGGITSLKPKEEKKLISG